MTRVVVSGACGRMGTQVLAVVGAAPDLEVAAALEAPGHPQLGDEVAPGVRVGDDPGIALAAAEVAIDFSLPEASVGLAEAAAQRGVALVSGTTGQDAAQLARIEVAAGKIPILRAANFSAGIQVLLDLVAEAARRLEDYDLEILELHHARKLDAPSGTALRLARTAAEARGVDLDAHAVYHREGETGARTPGAIGLQSLRAGDSIGEHTVYLAGPGERLELSHRALSRENFAQGAVRAARWLVGRPPGRYTLRDLAG